MDLGLRDHARAFRPPRARHGEEPGARPQVCVGGVPGGVAQAAPVHPGKVGAAYKPGGEHGRRHLPVSICLTVSLAC